MRISVNVELTWLLMLVLVLVCVHLDLVWISHINHFVFLSLSPVSSSLVKCVRLFVSLGAYFYFIFFGVQNTVLFWNELKFLFYENKKTILGTLAQNLFGYFILSFSFVDKKHLIKVSFQNYVLHISYWIIFFDDI